MNDLIEICKIYPWNELEIYSTVLLVVFLTPILLVIIEYFQKNDDNPKNDINYIIREWASSKYYCITVFWGILVGHFFLGTKNEFPPFDNEKWSVIIIAIILIVMWLHGRFMQKRRFTKTHQIFFLLLGVFIGHFAWSMTGVS